MVSVECSPVPLSMGTASQRAVSSRCRVVMFRHVLVSSCDVRYGDAWFCLVRSSFVMVQVSLVGSVLAVSSDVMQGSGIVRSGIVWYGLGEATSSYVL